MLIDLTEEWEEIKRVAKFVYERANENFGNNQKHRKYQPDSPRMTHEKANFEGTIGEYARAKLFGQRPRIADPENWAGDGGIDGTIPFGPLKGKTDQAKYTSWPKGRLTYQPKCMSLKAEIYILFVGVEGKETWVECAGWVDRETFQNNWHYGPLVKGGNPLYILERHFMSSVETLIDRDGMSVLDDYHACYSNFCTAIPCPHWQVVRGDIRCAKIGMSLKEMGFCPADTGVVNPESKVVEPPDEDEQYDMFHGR
ncbi:MAG: hypothetical protein ACYSW3_22680 [Planctomycetota bacterium]|jgi:hypothetical protein